MSITTTTHLNFRGQAREALTVYQAVFGGRVSLVTYTDAHNVTDPAEADQIMWGQVEGDDGFHVMAYDVPGSASYDRGDKAFFLSVRGADADEITRYWAALAESSTVIVDLAPAGWSTLYGMLRDRFGVTWVLDCVTPTDY